MYAVFSVGKELYDGFEMPPRAFDVSARRAIRALERRGLIHCAEGTSKRLDERSRLICWLPGHVAPHTFSQATGKQVEDAIVHTLEYIRTLEGTEKLLLEMEIADCGGICEYRQNCQVPYRWLSRQVRRQLDMYLDWRGHPAVQRVVSRLADKGIIKLGWKAYRQNGWLRLIG